MFDLSRRKALGLIAAVSVPPTIAVGLAPSLAAVTAETQEEKCIRLTKELLAELSLIKPHGESLGGPFVDLRNGEEVSCLRHVCGADGITSLVAMIKVGEAVR